jgi:starch phosphorylase
MKAGINGVINFSVLDGWWAEGFDGKNGWGLEPHTFAADMETRRRLEAKELLDTLEQQVIPLYFDKSPGYSPGWVRMAKRSMQSVIPRFNAQRMVTDYIEKFYQGSIERTHRLQASSGAGAAELARWKKEVRARWDGVSLRRLDEPVSAIRQGEKLRVQVAANLNGLRREDILVECLAGTLSDYGEFTAKTRHVLAPADEKDGEAIYEATLALGLSGLVSYRLRAYPYHPMLCHRFEMGFMKWI